jgi:hypothetical protein
MKAPLSIRILYWLTNIVFWLMILIATLVFVFNLILLTDLFGEDVQLRVQMPVPIEVVEDGSVSLRNGDIMTVRVEEAYGKLHLVDTPIFITRIVGRILFVMIMLGLYMTWRFKQFITNVKNGIVFETENINNLKQIAYGLLALWITTLVYMEVVYQIFVKYIEFDSIIMGNEYERYEQNTMFFAALALWALAHILTKGVEMKKEQELTI